MKGRYSKGIMSCNEAIKLQPRSVRAYLYRCVSSLTLQAPMVISIRFLLLISMPNINAQEL